MGLPEITEAKRLALRPGDSLAVRLDREPSDYDADRISQQVSAITGVPVIVLGPRMDIEVVRPDPSPTPAVDLDALVAFLRDYIRKSGGSVQSVLGGRS